MTRPRKMLARMLAAACAAASFPLDALAADRPELPEVDLEKMYGGWYLIATLPNWFEKGLVQPYDVFSRRDDGDIREDFYARWGAFDAPQKHYVVHDWVRAGSHNAHWRVRPVWPLSLPFLILYTDPDYRFVIFGEEDRKLGWIYSRTATVGDKDYANLSRHLQDLGYEPDKFVRFLQELQQFGKPGYWTEKVKNPSPPSTP